MVGKSCQRRLVLRPVSTFGQSDAADLRGNGSILLERLVEISETEKQDGVGMLVLDLMVLPHQRRSWGAHRGRYGNATGGGASDDGSCTRRDAKYCVSTGSVCTTSQPDCHHAKQGYQTITTAIPEPERLRSGNTANALLNTTTLPA